MTPRSSSIFMYFNVLGRLALIARGSGHNQTSVALVCHLLVHGRSIWDVGWGTYFFFFFPEEVYLGVLYFYFRLGMLRAGIGIIFFLPILNSDGLKKKKTP